jgi:hypothetical protein
MLRWEVEDGVGGEQSWDSVDRDGGAVGDGSGGECVVTRLTLSGWLARAKRATSTAIPVNSD